jgi:hypothetical protein
MLGSTSEQPGIHTHPYLLYIRLPEANSRMIEISGEKVRSAYQPCDFTNAIITAGQTVGLIHDVPMVKEIIDRMIKEPERVAQILGKIQRVYFLITAKKKGRKRYRTLTTRLMSSSPLHLTTSFSG